MFCGGYGCGASKLDDLLQQLIDVHVVVHRHRHAGEEGLHRKDHNGEAPRANRRRRLARVDVSSEKYCAGAGTGAAGPPRGVGTRGAHQLAGGAEVSLAATLWRNKGIGGR